MSRNKKQTLKFGRDTKTEKSNIYIMNIYEYSLYIPYIFHIYIYISPKHFPYFPLYVS